MAHQSERRVELLSSLSRAVRVEDARLFGMLAYFRTETYTTKTNGAILLSTRKASSTASGHVRPSHPRFAIDIKVSSVEYL